MSDTTEETTPSTAATLAPAAETEKAEKTDAELSAERGLSHKDGPKEPFVRMRDRIAAAAAARQKAAAAAAKEGEAP